MKGKAKMNDENLKAGKATQFTNGEGTARKAGIQSGKARRRKRAMKTAARALLDMKTTDAEAIKKLQEYGLQDDEITNATVILTAMIDRAIDGDVRAAQFLRDTAGESPQDRMRQEELKRRREMFEYKKERDAGEALEIEDLDATETAIYGEPVHDPVIKKIKPEPYTTKGRYKNVY